MEITETKLLKMAKNCLLAITDALSQDYRTEREKLNIIEGKALRMIKFIENHEKQSK